MIKRKVTNYQNNLSLLEQKFGVEAIIVFIIDVDRLRVDRFVQEQMPTGDAFFFTDYESFLDTDFGDQLTTGIYISGEDGWPYGLRMNDV